MKAYDFIKKELAEIKSENLYRALITIENTKGARITINGKELINFCSNNYLGLADHPKVVEKAIETLKKYGVGAGASRLVSGNFDIHEELEGAIAEYEGTEASIVFPTGYMANLGTIQALVGPEDVVIVDKLNHASIIDGARLSGAKLMVYGHKYLEKLEKALKKAAGHRRKLIVSDFIFSMDGDVAPVEDMLELAIKYDAMLMLDVAHSTGVVDLIMPDNHNIILMGTLSKAIGALGGFVAGSKNLIDYLRNKARAFIYTTALPPAIAAAALASFEIISKDNSLQKKLWQNLEYLRKKIDPLGYETIGSETQIIPLMIGDTKTTLDIAQYLFDNGIFLSAIRPPTVPKDTSRLRLTVTAMHTKAEIDHLASKLAEAKGKFLG
jgi:glycine C-acetyltransferase/8-amino-7-oxononanoate synthase